MIEIMTHMFEMSYLDLQTSFLSSFCFIQKLILSSRFGFEKHILQLIFDLFLQFPFLSSKVSLANFCFGQKSICMTVFLVELFEVDCYFRNCINFFRITKMYQSNKMCQASNLLLISIMHR